MDRPEGDDSGPPAWTADDQASCFKWWTAHVLIWTASLSLLGVLVWPAFRLFR
jgi:hypothetical protein